MENSIYDGKTICTFDLKGADGYYIEELVLEWKQAAAERKFICTECGAPVYLAAGQIKEPYFAHYDLAVCDYGSGQESEELKKGKRLLYSLLKQSFPEGEVMARYRMKNGMFSTLYVMTGGGRNIAVDYRLQNNSLEKFLERDAYYQGEKLLRIYVLGVRLDKESKQLDWYQNLLQNAMGYVVLLDTERERLILKKSISYRIGKQRKFKLCRKSYPIRELTLMSDGWMDCDFREECEKLNLSIEEERQQYQREQEIKSKLKEQYREERDKQLRLEEQYRLEQKYKMDEMRGQYLPEMGKTSQIDGLDPKLLEKCRKLIEEGNGHLVSKKYYDAIMDIRE